MNATTNDLLSWLAIDPHTASNVCLILLHSLWISATISITAWAINHTATRKNVEGRYLVCVAALVLNLLLTAWMAWTVSHHHTIDLTATNPSHLATTSTAQPPQTFPLDMFGDRHHAQSLGSPTSPALLFPRIANFGTLSLSSWSQLAPWVVIAYFAGLMIMVTRLSLALWHAQRLPRHATVIETGPVRQMLERVAKEWSLSAKVLLKQTEEIAVPKIVGLLRPTILIPTAAITGLTPIELEMLLVHEVAHVRRNDLWINLLQRIAETVLFFNPFIWLLSRRISTLREYCCDDMTCRSLSLMPIVEQQARSRYAAALLKVAEMACSNRFGNSHRSDQLNLTALAASGRSPSELRRRIARLVGEPLRDAISVSRGSVLLAATIALLVICLPRVTQSQTPADKSNNTAPGVERSLNEFDRILVDENELDKNAPKSFEPVVIKSPDNPKQNYIQRIVRLPDEPAPVIGGDEPISTVAGPDGNDFLKNVANTTGGKYYVVHNVKALPKIMEREARRKSALIIDSELLNDFAALNSGTDNALATRNRNLRSADELNFSEVLRRVCASNATADPAYLASLKLQLPKNATATTYEIGDKEKFFNKVAAEVETISGEPGFFEDILESLKSDPNGPMIDGRDVFQKQLGNRLTRITANDEEIWIWQIEPKLQRLAFLATFKRFVSADPGVRSLSKTKNLWSFHDIDEEGVETDVIAAAATDGHLWVASDLQLLKKIAPAFAE